VSEEEAEYVVLHATPPFPEEREDGKHCVWGQTSSGRFLQVIYLYRPVESVDLRYVPPHRRLDLEHEDEVVYIIHARDLEPHEKRRLRRRRET
jgi:hypothetical protein